MTVVQSMMLLCLLVLVYALGFWVGSGEPTWRDIKESFMEFLQGFKHD